MYFQQSEHNPPHVHVVYSGYIAEFNIRTGQVLEGKLPLKQKIMVRTWLKLRSAELLKIWETQNFEKVAPLKRKE